MSELDDRLEAEAWAIRGPDTGDPRDCGFVAGYIAGWKARTPTEEEIRAWLRENDRAIITREQLARLQRKAGEGLPVFP